MYQAKMSGNDNKNGSTKEVGEEDEDETNNGEFEKRKQQRTILFEEKTRKEKNRMCM